MRLLAEEGGLVEAGVLVVQEGEVEEGGGEGEGGEEGGGETHCRVGYGRGVGQ